MGRPQPFWRLFLPGTFIDPSHCLAADHEGVRNGTFFFDIKNGHRLIDPTGLDCVDDFAAMRSARIIARQIANDANPDLPRRISVLDEDRSEIGTVPWTKKTKSNMEFNETLRK